MERILFICGRNSGRSQMAEAYLKMLGKEEYQVYSAGLDPAESVNPLVVEVMKEEGIDLSHHRPKKAFDMLRKGELFSYVITVCDRETDLLCPVFPGITRRENWPFPDPENVTGTKAEKLDQVRSIRDSIKSRIAGFFGPFQK